MRWYIALTDDYDNEVKQIPYNLLEDALDDLRAYITEDTNSYLFDEGLNRIIVEYKNGELNDLLELI